MSLIHVYDEDGKRIGKLELSNLPRIGERLSFKDNLEGDWKDYSGRILDLHYNFIGYRKEIQITIG